MSPKPTNLKGGGRKLAMGLAVSGLAVLLAQGGCAESTPIDYVLVPDGGTGSNTGTGGGTSASGGSQGTGGNTGTTGSGGSPATGGSPGTGGGTGGGSATGGGNGTGGVIGTGGNPGTTGSGGTTGTGGRATGGNPGTTGSGGMTGTGGTTGTGGARATGGAGGSAAPTFTQVYQTILSVSCTGSQCHSPGSQGGVSFSSQSTAYSSVKGRVVAGNASGSSLYTLVNGGRMPPGNKLPAAQISLLAAWINAGALNN